MVCSFPERIRLLNIFEKSLSEYKEIQVKHCREIKFASGGHLFACTNQNNINVYKFYLPETPQVFKGHTNLVQKIQWLDDDSGFVSASLDKTIRMWKLSSVKLITHKESKKRDYEGTFCWKYE